SLRPHLGSRARFKFGPYPCPADIAGVGDCLTEPDLAVTLTDFACYLKLWANNMPSADVTMAADCQFVWGRPAGDGVSLEDFACYLTAWAAGCD
ncbi:MAG: GC-type dockerin domain-anchored protein, partial [Planctomycetota bacterium]